MRRQFINLIILFTVIITTASIVIAYGRGYRMDVGKKSLEVTGMLVANSQPNGASVYVDGQLMGATNTTISLAPKWYDVRIEKASFIPWQKKILIQQEIVSRADALLFPKNPSLSPLTTVGVKNPVFSPDGAKIAYLVTSENATISANIDLKKDGVWIYHLIDRPLGFSRDPVQVSDRKDLPFKLETSDLLWSPDSKKLMIVNQKGERETNILPSIDNYLQFEKDKKFIVTAYLLNTINSKQIPQNVTLEFFQILHEWQKEAQVKEKEKLMTLKPEIAEIATSAAQIIAFSPDETKILYKATSNTIIPQIITPPLIGTNSTKEHRNITKDNVYVYDIKEDKNFLIGENEKLTNNKNITDTLKWFPDSTHLIYIQENSIQTSDYDGINKITVYAGPFNEDFVVPWPNGSKLITLTTLNPKDNHEVDLYTINLQ